MDQDICHHLPTKEKGFMFSLYSSATNTTDFSLKLFYIVLLSQKRKLALCRACPSLRTCPNSQNSIPHCSGTSMAVPLAESWGSVQALPRKPYNGESRSRGGQDARSCTVSICPVELPPKPTRISGVAENIGLELGGKENWNSKRILIIL